MMTDIKHKIITELYNLFIKYKLYSMGLKRSKVERDDGVVYYEGGANNDKTIILIHGFADSKNGHLMVAKKLLLNYRVFIPDLPGFGDNTKSMQGTYSLDFMSDKIIELICEKKLARVHILGNSLGGAVAMDIASKAPELVKSLVLVGSAGFYTPTIRTVQNDLLEGNYVFQVKSDTEFRMLCDLIYYKAPKIPSFLFSYLSKNFQAEGGWYRKLLDDLMDGSSENDTLEKILSDSYNDRAMKFPMNTLLLWGEEDKVFPPEIAEFANALIPNSQLILLKNAGHVPQHENLTEYIDALLPFLQDNDNHHSLIGKV